MSELSGALCRGRWWLFDSIDVRDHEAARDLCDQCPVLAECAALLHEVQDVSRTLQSAGGGPTGTWAGQLVGKQGGGRRGRRNPREHGTERGYHQHRWDGDDCCDDCRRAHSAHVRGNWSKVAS